MYDYYLTFRSMTAAQQAAAALYRYAISAELTKAPRQAASMGCSYALGLSAKDAAAASGALRLEAIRYERAFYRGREVVL